MDNQRVGLEAPPHQPGIGAALDLLKQELVLLQEQDILLLKQLMNIHYSVRMLKRKLTHRTNSFTNLMNVRGPQFTPPTVARTMAHHTSLGRVMSEPARFLLQQQRSISITTEDEEEEEEDELADSFNSSGSDMLEPLKQSLNLDPETSNLLADMPISLRRKYLSSLMPNKNNNSNNNNASVTTMSRTSQKQLNHVSDVKPKKLFSCSGSVKICGSSNHQTVCVENKDQLKGGFHSDSDSSATGIEITVL